MKDSPGGTATEPPLRSSSSTPSPDDAERAAPEDARGPINLAVHYQRGGTERPFASSSVPYSPSDPFRQARRLPVRILKMLTAHSGHLLHPEYLQPLTSAPVSIELDAKKSPLALLAQTCSQIGKPDPPSSSKLASLSGSLGGGDSKDSSIRSSSKSGEQQHHSADDKSSFKPYSKSDCRKDVLVSKGSEKPGFRVPNGSANANGGSVSSCSSFNSNRAHSPSSGSPPLHTHNSHRQSHSPPTQSPALSQQQASHTDSNNKPGSTEQPGSDGSGGAGKKDSDNKPSSGLDGAQLANSSHVRASANSSNASSAAASPRPDSKADPQPGGGGGLSSSSGGHIAPVSPFKPGQHSVFPLPPAAAAMGYHGSIVGAYAGYPSQFAVPPGLDPTKSGLGGLVGLPGKHSSASSPLTGASPPSLMQGLCRDPYCLTYPGAPHLGGGSNCSTCVHDPVKSGYGLVYPSHHPSLHSLHPSLSSASTHSLASHPLYTYGFMLQNEQPHACNWVSAGGPCDKRFATSEELLAHLRTHTTAAAAGLPAMGAMDASKLLSSAYPSHLHLPPPPGSPGGLPSSFSALRGSPGLGLAAAARYHPYGKPGGPAGLAAMSSINPTSASAAAYYSPYALYSQRLGSASAMGYQ